MSCTGCATPCQALPDAEQPYGIEVHTADGVFVKQMVIPLEFSIVPQHAHVFDHLTMLAKGSVVVISDDDPNGTTYKAPAGIYIRAGVKHLIQSLEADTIAYCIHNTLRSGRVEIAEEHNLVSA